MASSKEIYCGPCGYEHITTSATKWCTECAEGYCNDCIKGHKTVKLTRNHHVILIEDYLKTQSFAVNLTCADHDKKIDFFCPSHDDVLCVVCVQQRHSKCTGLLALEEASKDVKTSTALSGLETSIDGILRNINNGKQNIQHTQASVNDQEITLCKGIRDMREQMNSHFDKMEEKTLNELTAYRQKCKSKLSMLTMSLTEKEKSLRGLKGQLETMKQFASNHQVFLGVHTMHKKVNDEEKYVKPLIVSIPEYTLTFENNPKVQSVVDEIDSFGRVQVAVKIYERAYVDHKIAQAQFQQPINLDIDAIRLELHKTIDLNSVVTEISDCLILPNKEMVFFDCGKIELSVYKADGSFNYNVNANDFVSMGTIINENRIAITYYNLPSSCTIGIIKFDTRKVDKILQNCFKSGGKSIAYQNSKLYVYDNQHTAIRVLNVDGSVSKTIAIELDSRQLFTVLSYKGIIYLKNATLYFVDMNGKEIWKYVDYFFKEITALISDKKGAVYATCQNGSVLAISGDGRRSRVLLSNPHELDGLTAAHIDKNGKQLLICSSKKGTAYLYKVV